jgi:hypothetical protein
MPPRARAADRRRLTHGQDLELGMVPQLRPRPDGQDGYRSAFTSEEHRYRAWLTHRERILGKLARPFGWALYEATDAELDTHLAEHAETGRALQATPIFLGDPGARELFG